MSKEKPMKTSIGGQALIEGIMMRGPKKTSMAVRKTDGTMFIETTDTVNTGAKIKKIPVIRGVFAFVDSLVSGYKSLMRSAEISMPTEEELAAEEERLQAEKAAKKAQKAARKAGAPIDDCRAPEMKPIMARDPEAPQADVEPEPAEPAAEAPAVAETAAEMAATDTAEPAAEEPAAEEPANAEPAETAAGAEPAAEKAAASASATADDAKPEGTKIISDGGMTLIMILGVVLGLGLSIFLFKFIPETVYEWTVERAVGERTGYGWNLLRSFITGLLKIAILVGYMWVVSLMKDIKRTFMYHGAEHKTIFCYEHGEELTVANVRKQIRFHPRCGTSFIILSVLVSIFFTMFIPAHLVEGSKILNTLARTGISLLMLPIIMGVGYELIRLAGRHDNWFTRAISKPGVWLQHITTKEPDDDMIECAIAAVKEVIPEDGSDQIK